MNFGPSDTEAVAAFMRNEKVEARRIHKADPLLGRELRKGYVAASSKGTKRRSESESQKKKKKKKQKKTKEEGGEEAISLLLLVRKMKRWMKLQTLWVDLDDWTDEDDSEDDE